jgi:HEAT repeat protein
VALAGVTDPNQEVRVAAIGLLGQIGDRNVLDVLRSQTEDPEPQIRAAAIRGLGAIGGRTAQPDVLRLMSDPEPLVRAAAVHAAVQAGLRPLAPAMVELLSDEDEQVRQAAAQALAALGDQSAVPALLRAFEEAQPELRGAIILAISRLDMSSLGELIDRLVEGDDSGSRLALARTLARLRWRGGLEHLGRLARDSDPEVRATAVQALGRGAGFDVPPPDIVVQAIASGLADSSEAVRARAIDVCSRRCLEDHARTLLSMLQDDPAPVVRERVALAIGLMRIRDGETALIAACRRAEPAEVRAAAALAAGAYDRNSLITLILEMPDEASIRELLRLRMKVDAWFRLLSRSLPRASHAELRALTAPSPAQAQSPLADGMRSALDASERVRLIAGLRAFQGEQGRDVLLQLVRGDPNPEVRTAALTSVGELLDPDELLAFGSRALGDPSIMVRRAAVRLFARVPPHRAFPRLIQALRVDDDPAVLAAVAGLVEEHFSAFRASVLGAPLEASRAVSVARLSRYLHHPDLAMVLAPLARSSAPEVREAVAEVWRHRPDVAEPVSLETLTADPVITVRRSAAGAAVAAGRYDLLDRMTQDPEAEIRREVALTLGQAPPVSRAGMVVLEHLEADSEMPVRAAAYVARLLQGVPVPLPPDLDPRVAAESVWSAADIGTLRNTARTAPSEDRRLAAGLALALIQDDVAREVARSDPAPAVRHRVGGALELSLPSLPGESA